MESSPRPGYYPDPSVPGYIRYWDGSKWVPGTSKPMPKKAGGAGDAEESGESGSSISAASAGPAARSAGGSLAFPAIEDDAAAGSDADFGSSFGSRLGSGFDSEAVSPTPSTGALTFDAELPWPQQDSQRTSPKASAFAPPRPLSEVSFDDAKPSPPPYSPGPRSLADPSFDDGMPESPRQAPPSMPGFQVAAGSQAPPAPQFASASGMGISITGAGMPAAPKQTPAQMSAANQALRIRLLRADGKPFDGPEITTGPKPGDASPNASRTEFDTPRGPKKQAPKVVVKTGPLERVGHTLAVLLISAVGIVPLGYLLLQSVHDREDKLAATISVPTKMNVLDSTSEGYLGGMVAVLLLVTVVYAMRLKQRRAR